MKNYLLLFDFLFLPKNKYKLVAERRAAVKREASNSFTNPDWRRGWDSNLHI